MAYYPAEVKEAARGLYCKRYSIREISRTLGIPRRTVYHWVDAEAWGDMLSHEGVEDAAQRRLVLLIARDDKTKADLQEIDRLTSALERFQRLREREQAMRGEPCETASAKPEQQGQQDQRGTREKRERKGGDSRSGKRRGRSIKNDVSHLTPEDFKAQLHQHYFAYQRELMQAKHYRNRQILKSRQIGATWYFAQEAFEDACTTGDDQIFLSATRAQAEVFRDYIIQIAQQKFDLELKGNPITLHTAHGPATLRFLSNNSKSAQGYHGHVYIDEFFWIRGFKELHKVATGMAAHKKWRRTLFSTPSAVTHPGYGLWNGDWYNARNKVKRQQFPGFKEMQSGILCPDNTWRKIITLEDAMAGGCDLFDLNDLKLEYGPEEFENLFMCGFVDDTNAVFLLPQLQACGADPAEWADYNPKLPRPFGNKPVWCGYDPSRSRDDASFVVIAPPEKPGGMFRVLERFKWVNKSYLWQVARIREITQRYNVQFMGIDTTGPGIGVYENVRIFYPRATSIHYSVQTKTELVLKGRELVESNRIQWDAADKEVGLAFMMIRQTTTPSGAMTYAANRSESTGHADAAFAILHGVSYEPLARPRGGCRVVIG
ncbi:terminase family protein [Desulfovibrio subterraneus]|uniref:terminase large subunit domain-containing protein n=1 Tax=Desulfovibrio subterraneus TaxID=2718620 RepID=UPI0022B90B13|nr:terminase family protein [Desulfovibrio subterraneus]WBF68268.1 terminase family protein [Desulfovibrio subterraneus]